MTSAFSKANCTPENIRVLQKNTINNNKSLHVYFGSNMHLGFASITYCR